MTKRTTKRVDETLKNPFATDTERLRRARATVYKLRAEATTKDRVLITQDEEREELLKKLCEMQLERDRERETERKRYDLYLRENVELRERAREATEQAEVVWQMRQSSDLYQWQQTEKGRETMKETTAGFEKGECSKASGKKVVANEREHSINANERVTRPFANERARNYSLTNANATQQPKKTIPEAHQARHRRARKRPSETNRKVTRAKN